MKLVHSRLAVCPGQAGTPFQDNETLQMFSVKRSFLLLVAVLLTAGLVPGYAQAADAPVLERIVQSGELGVGLSGDQPPFNAKGRDGQLLGLEVDLANLLAGALRVEAKFVPSSSMPWSPVRSTS
jgi:ABC-type amino acid transport substrate-binding protein